MADQPKIGARLSVTGFEQVGQSFQNLKASGKKAFDDIGASAKKAGSDATSAMKTAGSSSSTALGAAKSVASGVTGIVSGITSAVSKVTSEIASIGGKAVLAATVATGAIGGIYFGLQNLTFQTAEGQLAIANFARSIGESVADFSALAGGAEIAGVDVKDLAGGLKTLSQNILAAATDETSAAAKAFISLGLSVRNVDGSLKSPIQAFLELSNVLPLVANGSLKAKAANDLLGGSADALGPLLGTQAAGIRSLAAEAVNAGKQINEADEALIRAQLADRNRLTAAWDGIKLRLLGPFLSFFTETSAEFAQWLIDQRERIGRWGDDVVDTLRRIRGGFTALATGDFELAQARGFGALVPVVRVVRNLIFDLVDVMRGGSITRSTWLFAIWALLVSIVGAATAFGNAILGVIKNLNGGELPTFEGALKGVAHAIDQMVLGFQGITQGIDLKWAANIGSAVRTVFDVIASLVTFLGENRESITAFVDVTLKYLSDGFKAIGQIMSGKKIGEGQQGGNSFEFMQPFVDDVTNGIAVLTGALKGLYKDIKAAFSWFVSDDAKGIVSWITSIGDTIAHAFGLENWRQLGIVLLILHLTGALGFLQVLLGIFGSSLGIFNTFTNLTLTAAGLVTALGTALFGLTGIVAFFAGGFVLAFVAALGYLVYTFWPEIKAGFSKLVEWVGNPFTAAADLAVGAWNLIKTAWTGAGDFFSALFAGTGSFFSGLIDGIGASFTGLWSGIQSGASGAWDFVQSAWSGSVGWFQTALGTIGGFFESLWDKAKSGAATAWDSIKSFFGFGSAQAQGAGDNSPRFAEGGVVRGAGGTDKVSAWLTDGEGVLTTKAMKHYGAGILDMLNSLAIPAPALAGIPVAASAGGRSPGRFALSVGGISVPGLHADGPDTVRVMKDIFRSPIRSGRGPRWKGGR